METKTITLEIQLFKVENSTFSQQIPVKVDSRLVNPETMPEMAEKSRKA